MDIVLIVCGLFILDKAKNDGRVLEGLLSFSNVAIKIFKAFKPEKKELDK